MTGLASWDQMSNRKGLIYHQEIGACVDCPAASHVVCLVNSLYSQGGPCQPLYHKGEKVFPIMSVHNALPMSPFVDSKVLRRHKAKGHSYVEQFVIFLSLNHLVVKCLNRPLLSCRTNLATKNCTEWKCSPLVYDGHHILPWKQFASKLRVSCNAFRRHGLLNDHLCSSWQNIKQCKAFSL